MNTAVHWMKIPIVGMPGTECGRYLRADGTTEIARDFQDEFGSCEEAARWCVGPLLLCQEHAAKVAEDFGDSIEEIEAAWREECL